MSSLPAAKLLEKKATFLEGCKELQSSPEDQLFPACHRARVLLHTRYTSPAFWKGAHELFKASSVRVSDGPQKQQLQAWEQEAASFLDEGSTNSAGQQQQQQQQHREPLSLLQELLGLRGGPQAAFDDAGFINRPSTQEQQHEQQQRHEQQQQQQERQQQEYQQQHEQQQQQQQQQHDQQGQYLLDLLEGQQQGGGGTGENFRQRAAEEALEALGQVQLGQDPATLPSEEQMRTLQEGMTQDEQTLRSLQENLARVERLFRDVGGDAADVLDRIADVVAAQTAEMQTRRAPPASKKAVAALPLFTWDEESEQREQRACSICLELLKRGDQVQQLPCHKSHLFHPACIAPWLAKSNSCPTCREELPTDDMNYEAEKERRAEQECERRGALNALTHNEFMYM